MILKLISTIFVILINKSNQFNLNEIPTKLSTCKVLMAIYLIIILVKYLEKL